MRGHPASSPEYWDGEVLPHQVVGLLKMLIIGLSNKENQSIDMRPEEKALKTVWSLLFLTLSALDLENRNV